jgi:DNA-binding MarR family transcriptional regulator
MESIPMVGIAARRKRIAKGVVAGRAVKDIAAEMGLSRETVSRTLNHPETQNYLSRLLSKSDDRLEKLVDKSLTAIDLGLMADKDDKADHASRMRAVAETARILALRAGKQEGETSSNGAPPLNLTVHFIREPFQRVEDIQDGSRISP